MNIFGEMNPWLDGFALDLFSQFRCVRTFIVHSKKFMLNASEIVTNFDHKSNRKHIFATVILTNSDKFVGNGSYHYYYGGLLARVHHMNQNSYTLCILYYYMKQNWKKLDLNVRKQEQQIVHIAINLMLAAWWPMAIHIFLFFFSFFYQYSIYNIYWNNNDNGLELRPQVNVENEKWMQFCRSVYRSNAQQALIIKFYVFLLRISLFH